MTRAVLATAAFTAAAVAAAVMFLGTSQQAFWDAVILAAALAAGLLLRRNAKRISASCRAVTVAGTFLLFVLVHFFVVAALNGDLPATTETLLQGGACSDQAGPDHGTIRVCFPPGTVPTLAFCLVMGATLIALPIRRQGRSTSTAAATCLPVASLTPRAQRRARGDESER